MAPDTTPPSDTPATPRPPMLSQAEAARVCQVSTATIRRARQAGRLPGSVETGEGWRIPVPELVAAGLLDRATPPDTVIRQRVAPDTTPPSDTPATRAEVDDLRAKLAQAEQRAAVAEAVAAERGRALDDLRLSMRALTAGTPDPTPEPPTALQAPTAPSAPMQSPRRWFRRR